MTHVAFTKMQALGNDFMVIDGLRYPVDFNRPHQITQWGDRKHGVGFDQLLWVGPPTSPEADFDYRIFNADGSEVGQCGNGARCLARFIFERGISAKRHVSLKTHSGLMHVTRHALDWYAVEMAAPVFEHTSDGLFVDVGNPHWVIETEQNVAFLDLHELGPRLQALHPVNIEWVNRIHDDHLRIRVFERGVGETMGCGSGAVASAAAMIYLGKSTAQRIRVDMSGGYVMVSWPQQDARISLEGEAHRVFDATLSF